MLSYGDDEMEKLLSHYVKDHTHIYIEREVLYQSADHNTGKILADWASFKEIMLEHLFVSKLSGQENREGNRSKCDKPIDKTMEGV